jgi:hypothetical protein
MPAAERTPIDRFFVDHSDADILLCLQQVFFARQKQDAAWLSAETPLANALYRATIPRRQEARRARRRARLYRAGSLRRSVQ